jgi:hypothetical protein
VTAGQIPTFCIEFSLCKDSGPLGAALVDTLPRVRVRKDFERARKLESVDVSVQKNAKDKLYKLAIAACMKIRARKRRSVGSDSTFGASLR